MLGEVLVVIKHGRSLIDGGHQITQNALAVLPRVSLLAATLAAGSLRTLRACCSATAWRILATASWLLAGSGSASAAALRWLRGTWRGGSVCCRVQQATRKAVQDTLASVSNSGSEAQTRGPDAEGGSLY